MLPVFVGQLVVPALLAGWMILRPLRSAAGFVAQVAGSLLALVAMKFVGVWLFPPWWVPHVAAGTIVIAALWHVRRRTWSTVRPAGALGWSGVALFGALAIPSAVILVNARRAAQIPAEPVTIDLAFPFPDGRYLVVNGGGSLLINAHHASMDTTLARLRPWRGNGYAVDLVATDAFGMRVRGLRPRDPAAYRTFGVPVLAPCAGMVIDAVDGHPDMPVPDYDRENPPGNYVMLDCGGVHIALAHFSRGSLRVREGDPVDAGTVLGTAGNSGGTDEPHLHIHAQWPGTPVAPMGGDPLPIHIEGRYLVRGDRVRIGE